MNLRLKRYKKEYNHSYTLGVFPSLELLTHRPGDVLGLVAHPKGMENAGVLKIQAQCRQHGIPFDIQEKVFDRIRARNNDYALGVFRKYENELDPGSDHIILVNPAGMGNLGTIIRTMLGFGFNDLAIIQPGADIFHPEAVRASMGALFQVRFSRFQDFETYQHAFPRNMYPMLTDGDTSLPDTRFTQPYGLVFGSESAGLSSDFHQLGTTVRIPQTDGIDSLNLAVSVGVTLYHANCMK